MIKINENNSIVEIEFFKSDRDGKIKIQLGNRKMVFVNGIKIVYISLFWKIKKDYVTSVLGKRGWILWVSMKLTQKQKNL